MKYVDFTNCYFIVYLGYTLFIQHYVDLDRIDIFSFYKITTLTFLVIVPLLRFFCDNRKGVLFVPCFSYFI